jgi:hypothetical protein
MAVFIFLILILVGLALAFFGKRIMETIAFIIGAIIGANLAYLIALNPRVQEYVADYMSGETCIIIAVVIGALIGGYLGKSFMYGMISMMVAGSVAYVASFFTQNAVVILVVFFVALVIMYFLVEQFLAIVTALLGGCLVGLGVMGLTAGLGFLAFVLFLIIAGALTIFGARYQLDES